MSKYDSVLKQLVEEHKEIQEQPLLVAVGFKPNEATVDNELYLLEVAENVGDNEVDPEQSILEVEFLSSPELHIGDGGRLHLLLTNPTELDVAAREGWAGFERVAEAVRKGNFEVLYRRPDESSARVLSRLGIAAAA